MNVPPPFSAPPRSYLAHGTATDYMFEGLHVPMAFTWEIYGDFKAHFDDCFRMFNPLDKAGVDVSEIRLVGGVLLACL